MSQFFDKDPGEVLAFTIDWSNVLASGDTIATSVWSVPSGITQDSETETATTSTITVSGGTVGVSYRCECTVTTDAGETLVRSIHVQIMDK